MSASKLEPVGRFPAEYVSVSPSGSVAVTVNVSSESSSTLFAPMLSSTGASFTGVIVTVTVAVFESVVPSLTLKVKVSIPLAFSFGVYMKAPVDEFVMDAVPLLPLVTSTYVSASPSTSLASRVPLIDVSSSVLTD